MPKSDVYECLPTILPIFLNTQARSFIGVSYEANHSCRLFLQTCQQRERPCSNTACCWEGWNRQQPGNESRWKWGQSSVTAPHSLALSADSRYSYSMMSKSRCLARLTNIGMISWLLDFGCLVYSSSTGIILCWFLRFCSCKLLKLTKIQCTHDNADVESAWGTKIDDECT